MTLGSCLMYPLGCHMSHVWCDARKITKLNNNLMYPFHVFQTACDPIALNRILWEIEKGQGFPLHNSPYPGRITECSSNVSGRMLGCRGFEPHQQHSPYSPPNCNCLLMDTWGNLGVVEVVDASF